MGLNPPDFNASRYSGNFYPDDPSVRRSAKSLPDRVVLVVATEDHDTNNVDYFYGGDGHMYYRRGNWDVKVGDVVVLRYTGMARGDGFPTWEIVDENNNETQETPSR